MRGGTGPENNESFGDDPTTEVLSTEELVGRADESPVVPNGETPDPADGEPPIDPESAAPADISETAPVAHDAPEYDGPVYEDVPLDTADATATDHPTDVDPAEPNGAAASPEDRAAMEAITQRVPIALPTLGGLTAAIPKVDADPRTVPTGSPYQDSPYAGSAAAIADTADAPVGRDGGDEVHDGTGAPEPTHEVDRVEPPDTEEPTDDVAEPLDAPASALDPDGIDAATVEGIEPVDVQPVEPSGADPDGAGPDGVDPSAVDPSSVDPSGVDPRGVDPGGVDPGAVDPTADTVALSAVAAAGRSWKNPISR